MAPLYSFCVPFGCFCFTQATCSRCPVYYVVGVGSCSMRDAKAVYQPRASNVSASSVAAQSCSPVCPCAFSPLAGPDLSYPAWNFDMLTQKPCMSLILTIFSCPGRCGYCHERAWALRFPQTSPVTTFWMLRGF